LLVSTLLLALSGCAGVKKEYKSYSLDYFDTATTVIGYETSERLFEERVELIESLLLEYHRLFDIYSSYPGMNNLYTVNNLENGVHSEVEVDEKIINMLTLAKEMHEKTNGKLNVAMGSVLSIWHKYRKAGEDDVVSARLPSMESLEAASLHTDISSLVINKERSTVYISDPDARLDVGAIAKGYAVEMVAAGLEDEGKSGYVLDVGGNLRTIGTKPSGSGWTAGVINPDRTSMQSYVYTMTISDCALVTSGSYENSYTVAGVSYHHIINPDTLMPASHYLSVSVKSNSSAKSDALSTAIFNMKYEEAESFVNQHPDLFVVLVMPSGEVRTLGKQ
jgi:thiamine biosynthesis lipoprotein